MASYRLVQMLRFIAGFCAAHAYGPTVREFADGVRLNSTSVGAYWLTKMEMQGYLEWPGHRARTIRLTTAGQAVVEEEA